MLPHMIECVGMLFYGYNCFRGAEPIKEVKNTVQFNIQEIIIIP